MGQLITAGLVSLDGLISDTDGRFDWAVPDAELHGYVNELEKSIGTYLYGRRMYEVMSYWADPPADSHPVEQEYAAIWQDTDKVVYSTTLDSVATPRTRLERSFDAAAVAELKASSERDISVAGPVLAASAFRAGLVDEIWLFVPDLPAGRRTPGPRAHPRAALPRRGHAHPLRRPLTSGAGGAGGATTRP
jgi:dihydrofolate reductase